MGTATATILVALLLPASVFAHAERPSYYPSFNVQEKKFGPALGEVPKYRSKGPSRVVCKSDSRTRVRRIFRANPRLLRKRLAMLRRCRYHEIQAAVDAARNGDRILLMPGVYREEPSRAAREPAPECADLYTENAGVRVPSYEYQLKCPNAQNLIAIIGDGPDEDIRCDRKCDLQVEGLGRRPQDVLISGERSKLNVIRADRADGIYLKNFEIQNSDFNNIYALETNGFRFDDIESHHSREYGFLSFASDQGLYENLQAHHNGDSGIYPGAGPEGRCQRYGIEIRNSESYLNNIGYSGTAGNGVWAHDNKFHHNGTGMTTDSFAAGHPGMPQDCAKWERNYVYSNNLDLFNAEMDAYCKRPIEERDDPNKVCSTFQNPVGTGMLIAGGNGNIVRDNWIWDNWRNGTTLHWVPATLRGEDSTGQSENDPLSQYDTSNSNRYEGNHMGVRPDGTRDPNGTDFWWDEEGAGNCWSGNLGAGGARPTSSPSTLPPCPGGSLFSIGNPAKQAFLIPCALWNPQTNTDPPGCDWFVVPPEPK
jgi:hypothetical protein